MFRSNELDIPLIIGIVQMENKGNRFTGFYLTHIENMSIFIRIGFTFLSPHDLHLRAMSRLKIHI